MYTKIGFEFYRDFMSYDEFEYIVRRARAERDAALGRAIRTVILAVAAGYGRLIGAIEEALQLRALAMLDDRQLTALGLNRQNLPGLVYGWEPAGPAPVDRESELLLVRPDRIAA